MSNDILGVRFPPENCDCCNTAVFEMNNHEGKRYPIFRKCGCIEHFHTIFLRAGMNEILLQPCEKHASFFRKKSKKSVKVSLCRTHK